MAGMNLVSGQFLAHDGSAAVPAWAFTSDPDVGLYKGALTLGVAIAGVKMAEFGVGAASAFMSQGLSLDQGAYDDNIMEFKSSDVGHGMTTVQDTNTYGAILKADPTTGGLHFWGLTLHYVNAFRFRGITDGETTTKGTGGWACMMMECSKKNGTSHQLIGNTGNLFAIKNYNLTRFIFDGAGNAHADVDWIDDVWDEYDDLVLVRDMNEILQDRETEAQAYKRKWFEDQGIVGKDSWHVENGNLRCMLNTTALQRLHHGALIQAADRIIQLESRIEELERRT